MKFKTYLALQALAGGVAGFIMSITPLILLLIVLIVFLVLWTRSIVRACSRSCRLAHIISFAACLGVITLASHLPVKALDRSLPPAQYPRMSVAELAFAIESECGLHIDVSQLADTNAMVVFTTSKEMSLLNVLNQLCDTINASYHYTFHPEGSTFLWGPDHMTIYLKTVKEPGNGKDDTGEQLPAS